MENREKITEKNKNTIVKNKGITLIALIITVVVMLILAGVAIGAVVGGDGLFNKIGQATEIYENVSEDEKSEIHDMVTQIDIYLQDTNNPIVKGKAEINTIVNENQTYDGRLKGTYYNPIIPKGFAPINENGADWGSADGYKKGLVITDEVNADGNSIGNEFVWVPVDGTIVKFERYNFGKIDSEISSFDDLTESVPEELSASVTINGGFYIARFEAGKPADGILATDGSVSPVSKQGAEVWSAIAWSENGINDDVNPGNGIVTVARNMYSENNTNYGVASTLIYGVQWDAALKFIGAYGGDNEYATDSTGKGNYLGTSGVDDIDLTSKPAECGARDGFRQKNIYDMGGNVREWTMEKYGTSRINRGGAYNNSGLVSSAASRSGIDVELISGRRRISCCSLYFLK